MRSYSVGAGASEGAMDAANILKPAFLGGTACDRCYYPKGVPEVF